MMSRANRFHAFRAAFRVVLAAVAVLAGSGVVSAQVPLEVLHSFGGADGNQSSAALIQADDGNLYGTTYSGGAFGGGTVFKMALDGTVSVLHSFAGGADGALPSAALVQAVDGNFYGTTTSGGVLVTPFLYGGTLFKMTPDGTFTVLHAFVIADGSFPNAPLIQANDGNLYGTARDNGADGCGTVFRMTLDGAISVVHSFASGADGCEPNYLIQATDGNFYGTTGGALIAGAGTIFKMTPDGTVTTVHNFSGGPPADPVTPDALIQAVDGNFYGVSFEGGQSFGGTVFRMTPDGTVTVLHSFAAGDGNPNALFLATDGTFYGTTDGLQSVSAANSAPACPCGTVFKITAGGAFTTVHVFTGSDGFNPTGLVEAADGNLYGTTLLGGDFSDGTAYRLDTDLCIDTLSLSDAAGTLHIGFTLRSSAPATWSTWAVFTGGSANLWSVSIPAVSPALSFDLPIRGVPAIGPLGILTALSTAQQGVMCFDWKVVDTGSAAGVR